MVLFGYWYMHVPTCMKFTHSSGTFKLTKMHPVLVICCVHYDRELVYLYNLFFFTVRIKMKYLNTIKN